MAIQNDSEFRSALDKLSTPQQRELAARFTDSVLALCSDPRIKTALSAAQRSDISDVELNAIYQSTKAACVESYTQCGKETDWMIQAGHFVAEAAKSCVKPAEPGRNLAWDAAMSARMARTCETIAKGQGTHNREADSQYRLAGEYAAQ
jgi:hypothetical protein